LMCEKTSAFYLFVCTSPPPSSIRSAALLVAFGAAK
jgi:hypothetical protein